jgi:hypothetical protein
MNKWEREVFLPKLGKKAMTDKEFAKVSREYDHKSHNVTRQAFNEIHCTVNTINKINGLAEDTALLLSLEVNGSRLETKWSKKGYLNELKTGPMSDDRFTDIMDNLASTNTRKFKKEYNVQRQVANGIWSRSNGDALA